MIYDGHAYCIPDLRGNGGFADAEQFRRHLQLAIATHFQPVWRAADRSPADASGLAEPVGDWSFDSLKEADFRVAGYGRFEWTVDGEDYVKQYMPPSVRDMAYSAEDLVAEMDYAGVDMALLHRTPYLGVGNDFIAECCRKFPDRIQGLAHVEEWTVRTDTDRAIRKLQEAIRRAGAARPADPARPPAALRPAGGVGHGRLHPLLGRLRGAGRPALRHPRVHGPRVCGSHRRRAGRHPDTHHPQLDGALPGRAGRAHPRPGMEALHRRRPAGHTGRGVRLPSRTTPTSTYRSCSPSPSEACGTTRWSKSGPPWRRSSTGWAPAGWPGAPTFPW